MQPLLKTVPPFARFRIVIRNPTLLMYLGFVGVVLLVPQWTVDDAYITLRYARNLVEHGSLVWNVGDMPPVEGYTGLVWPLIAAALMWMQIDPVVGLDVISYGCTFVMPGIFWLVLKELGASEPQRRVGLALLLIGPWWGMHAGSGLETMLFTVELLVCVWAWLRRSAWVPLLLLLSALTRPEGVAFAVVLFGASWWRGERRIGNWLGLFVLPGALYFAWRWHYYGQLLPNTFYVKGNGGRSSWLDVAQLLAAVILLPLLAWRASRPRTALLSPVRGLVVGLLALMSGLLIFYGQSELMMNYEHRFFVPFLPLLWLMLVATWGDVTWHNSYGLGYAILCVVTWVGVGTTTANYAYMLRSEHAPAAAWIHEHIVPTATLLVIVDAGWVPWATDLRTIDGGALNDAYLAHERDSGKSVDYLFAQQPTVVLLATGNLGSSAAEPIRRALLADRRWQTGYTLMRDFQRAEFNYHQQIWVRNGTSLR